MKIAANTLYLSQPFYAVLLLAFLMIASSGVGYAQEGRAQSITTTQQLTLDDLRAKLPAKTAAFFDKPLRANRLTAGAQYSRYEERKQRASQESYLKRINERNARRASVHHAAKNTSFVQGNEQDSLALIALYNGTNGNSWRMSTGWLTGPLSSWYGITLNEDGRVIEIDLPANQIEGSFPVELTTISELQFINLFDNFLDGNIPLQINQWTQLEVLNLSFNFFRGEIPSTIHELPSLRSIVLWGNSLDGTIPLALGTMTQLEELLLFANRLEGVIPTSLGDLQNLTELSLDLNGLTGAIPPELAQLSNLEQLSLDFNALTGGVPDEFADLLSLQSIFIGNNPLGGEFPDVLLNLINLRALSIPNAELSGEIPGAINRLSVLSFLDLSINQFTGPLPESLFDINSLVNLNLSNNALTGIISENLPIRLENLVDLNLANNQFTGTIPESIEILRILQSLDLSGNQLEGPVPSLSFNFDLRYVYLNDNQLSGTLTDQLDELMLLSELDLSRNNFSGELPGSIGRFLILEELFLGENSFSGVLPETMGNLKMLQLLNLFNNQFSGNLPSYLGEFSGLILLDLGSNAFTGNIPTNIGSLTNLLFLLLDANNLSGELPKSVENIEFLFGMTLAGNQITGLVNFSEMPILSLIEVENNRLTFEDIEPLLSLNLSTLSYVPQREVYPIIDNLGANTRYQVNVGGSANTYQWFRNEEALAGETSSTLELDNNTNSAAMDTIVAEITSNIVTDLILGSTPARTDAVLQTVAISPDTPTITQGDTLQFMAIGTDQFDSHRLFSTEWSSTGGIINASGLYVSGNAIGSFEVSATNPMSGITATTSVTIKEGNMPTATDPVSTDNLIHTLHANYPNPFASNTRLEFQLGSPAHLKLQVFDLLGREVMTVVNQYLPAGAHSFMIHTQQWPAGVYFYTIEAGKFVSTRSMIKIQ